MRTLFKTVATWVLFAGLAIGQEGIQEVSDEVGEETPVVINSYGTGATEEAAEADAHVKAQATLGEFRRLAALLGLPTPIMGMSAVTHQHAEDEAGQPVVQTTLAFMLDFERNEDESESEQSDSPAVGGSEPPPQSGDPPSGGAGSSTEGQEPPGLPNPLPPPISFPSRSVIITGIYPVPVPVTPDGVGIDGEPYEAGVGTGPGSEYCVSLAKKIKNVSDRIKKRLEDLKNNPLNLPERAPGDVEKPSLSRWGHRKLINMDKALLAQLTAEFAWRCTPKPPPVTVPVPVPVPEPLPLPNVPLPEPEEAAAVVTVGVVLYWVVSEASRLFPPRNLIPIP